MNAHGPGGWQYGGPDIGAGLNQVRVNKVDLVKQLIKNRDNHRAKFEEAMEGYKIRSIELLEEHIERIKANAPEQVSVILPLPEDHTEDYDVVIAQLGWSLDDVVILNSHEFETYVLDEWGWKDTFIATASMYGA